MSRIVFCACAYDVCICKDPAAPARFGMRMRAIGNFGCRLFANAQYQCMYVCMYIKIRRHQHTRAYIHIHIHGRGGRGFLCV